MTQLLERSETLLENQWNVSSLFSSFKKWEEEYALIVPKSDSPHWPHLQKFRGRLKESAHILAELFADVFSLLRQLEKLYTYAHLRHDEDITHDAHKNAYQRISSALIDFQQETAWIEPEMLELPKQIIDDYLKADVLKPWRFHIEKIIRMGPHTLSADKEELLAMASKSMQSSPKAFSALNNADLKFGKVKDQNDQEHDLTHGLYQLYLRSPDRTLRENAFKTLHGKFNDFENTMAELLSGEIESHVFNAKAHKFKSSLDAALFPKKISTDVYHSLIKAVREGLPSLHRYMAIRKKRLKLDQLHLYDLYVPLMGDVEIRLDYQEAQEVVIESVAPLGSEYQNVLKKGLKQDKWVDRFENKNKRSGAYSSGCYDSFPFILLNFRGILRDTFTLAHEAGHSMHSYLSNQTQSFQYSRYPIFVAEVASTFNEELLMDLLLKKRTNKNEKLFLVNEKIEDIRGTLFRQTMFAEFELKIHELAEANIPLTPALLKKIYLQLNQEYFGPDVYVDPEIAIEWARIPHFYYNFYVYQYATGISAALSLSEKVLHGDPSARENYLHFLKGGGSLFPIELLKLAGVDMSSTEPVTSAIRKFDSLLTQFEELA